MDRKQIDEMITKLDSQLSLLNKTPCSTPETPCLEAPRGKGWGDLNPESMDAGCAAYWYMSMAANELRRMKRIVLLEEQEAANNE